MATLTRDFERILLETALDYSRGRRMEAAQRLGIGRTTLTRNCAELGLNDTENGSRNDVGDWRSWLRRADRPGLVAPSGPRAWCSRRRIRWSVYVAFFRAFPSIRLRTARER